MLLNVSLTIKSFLCLAYVCFGLQNMFTGVFFFLQLFDGHNGFEQLLYTPRRISSIYSKQLLCFDLLELTYGTTD